MVDPGTQSFIVLLLVVLNSGGMPIIWSFDATILHFRISCTFSPRSAISRCHIAPGFRAFDYTPIYGSIRHYPSTGYSVVQFKLRRGYHKHTSHWQVFALASAPPAE